MKIPVNSIKRGMVIAHDDGLWNVMEATHVKIGKGPARLQLIMKNIVTGNKTNIRLNTSDSAERAELEQRKYQYLYVENDDLIFMDTESGNFEQISVSKEIFEDQLPFLEDNMIVKIEFYQDRPIKVELPSSVILEIAETAPVIKGATATSSYKPAVMSNGIKVMVPAYIVTGERIVVKTEDSSYVERAK